MSDKADKILQDNPFLAAMSNRGKGEISPILEGVGKSKGGVEKIKVTRLAPDDCQGVVQVYDTFQVTEEDIRCDHGPGKYEIKGMTGNSKHLTQVTIEIPGDRAEWKIAKDEYNAKFGTKKKQPDVSPETALIVRVLESQQSSSDRMIDVITTNQTQMMQHQAAQSKDYATVLRQQSESDRQRLELQLAAQRTQTDAQLAAQREQYEAQLVRARADHEMALEREGARQKAERAEAREARIDERERRADERAEDRERRAHEIAIERERSMAERASEREQSHLMLASNERAGAGLIEQMTAMKGLLAPPAEEKGTVDAILENIPSIVSAFQGASPADQASMQAMLGQAMQQKAMPSHFVRQVSPPTNVPVPTPEPATQPKKAAVVPPKASQ